MGITNEQFLQMQSRLDKSRKAPGAVVLNAQTANAAPGFQLAGFVIIIKSQIRGGKNNITVTRTGRRFPNKEWAAWRDLAVASVKAQLPASFKTITVPVNVRLEYWAGDKRRRDMPAIIDAIWHVLEKAGVVDDDTLLWVAESERDYDKENPRATITFL